MLAPVTPWWSTACPDWEDRIVCRQSLVPFGPLFPDEAEAALDVFKNLKLVDVMGRPTIGEVSLPWALDLPTALFGAYDPDTGRRLIRFFFEFVAKKNGKSTRAAGIMITALLRNWRESGEYFILAPTKEVADNSFFPARDMVRADPNLVALLHIQEAQRLITHRNTGAFLKVIAADSETVSGKKTIGLLVDELWQFGKKTGAGAMIREASGGLLSRPEGFVIYLSTQSDQAPAGVFEQKLKDFRDIRDGKVNDPRSLPILYEFPERLVKSGEYRDPKFWYISNPNLGVAVSEEAIADELAKAERAGKAELINAEAKFLNIQVGMAMRSDGWAGALVWERGIDEKLRTLDWLLDRCEVCTVGIDGGGLDDLLGVSVVGREKSTKHHLAWCHALISDIGIERRKANIEQYNQFEADGDLTKFVYSRPAPPPADSANGGDAAGSLPPLLGQPSPNVVPISDAAALARQIADLPVNIRFVVELVRRIKDRGLLAQVGVDAAGIGAIVDALGLIGVTQDADKLDPVRQGIALMGAIKTVEIKLADFSFRHGGTRLMAWCASNLRVIPTRTAMMVARDEAGFGKVDPLMAIFNAEHLMCLNPEVPRRSIYEDLAALREGDQAKVDPAQVEFTPFQQFAMGMMDDDAA